MTGLKISDILKLVNRYIGVSGGYLGDFSYRTHAEFYPEYCNLDINPYQYEGTTRGRFIEILKSSAPDAQAEIVRGVLERFPLEAENAPPTRTQSLQDEFLKIARGLESAASVPNPTPQIMTMAVERALSDTEALLQSAGAISGVDRIHTALHGYLRAVCNEANIQYSKNDGITRLFKLLRQQHPIFQNLGARQQDIERVLQSFGNVMDALNPIRNQASIAHPNETLLEKDEAMLVINVARTLIHYLDAKISK